MAELTAPNYRRDYSGETIQHVENGAVQNIFVTARRLPHDLSNSKSIVLGNGISRLSEENKTIIAANNRRMIGGYKMTYACNAAYRDTPADYYIVKSRELFAELSLEQHTSVFTTNDMWATYRQTNLLPYVYHLDAGASAAYLAAFDGAKQIFLFGFDGTDGITSDNVYANTYGYSSPESIEDFKKFNKNLYDVISVYSDTNFYRIRNHNSSNFDNKFNQLPNYFEVSNRDAVLIGDF